MKRILFIICVFVLNSMSVSADIISPYSYKKPPVEQKTEIKNNKKPNIFKRIFTKKNKKSEKKVYIRNLYT